MSIIIHVASRHLSTIDGITGLLIFDGTTFLQVLEGVEDAIDSLVERLRDDQRHTDFVVRDERFIEDRSFSDWSMNLIRVSKGFGDARTEIAPVLPASTGPEVRELLFKMTDGLTVGG